MSHRPPFSWRDRLGFWFVRFLEYGEKPFRDFRTYVKFFIIVLLLLVLISAVLSMLGLG